MPINDIMELDIFKIITRSVAESYSLETMGNRSTQLLVGSLGIKASAIFALNPESEELEHLASFVNTATAHGLCPCPWFGIMSRVSRDK